MFTVVDIRMGTRRWRHRAALLGMVVLVIFAGCALPFNQPTKQEHPVRLQLNNSANTTHTFEVSVVELPAEYSIRLSDGRSDTTSIGQGIASHNPGDNRTFTAVELPESARLHGRYRLTPNGSARTSIEKVPSRGAVVVVVYQGEEEIVWYITANCDDLDLAALRVTRTSDWVSVTHSCV